MAKKKLTYEKHCGICGQSLFNMDEKISGFHRHCKKRKEEEEQKIKEGENVKSV